MFNGMEDLDHDNREQDELDGELVSPVVDPCGDVEIDQVVFVHQVLDDEVDHP